MRTVELKIKEIREQKGMTIRELSEKSGVSVGYLSELENKFGGKENPSVKVICDIAAALGVEPEELYECE